MKKTLILFTLIIFSVLSIKAQKGTVADNTDKKINAGFGLPSGLGKSVYAGVEFVYKRHYTLGAEVFTSIVNEHIGVRNDIKHNCVGIVAIGNYHMNKRLGMPKEWDLYVGGNIGFYYISKSTILYESVPGAGAQIGARYYFNSFFGANIELGIGLPYSPGFKLGITYNFI